MYTPIAVDCKNTIGANQCVSALLARTLLSVSDEQEDRPVHLASGVSTLVTCCVRQRCARASFTDSGSGRPPARFDIRGGLRCTQGVGSPGAGERPQRRVVSSSMLLGRGRAHHTQERADSLRPQLAPTRCRTRGGPLESDSAGHSTDGRAQWEAAVEGGIMAAESTYVSAPGVAPVRIESFRSVRRRMRRGHVEDLASGIPAARSVVERWDFNFSF